MEKEMILKDYLNNKKIVIFGTGYVAKKFYCALKNHHMEEQIVCCTNSFIKDEDMWLDNIPINKLEDINNVRDIVICVAVHYSIKDEIINRIEKMGEFEYVWIYPYLYEFLLGTPQKEMQKVCVNKIIEKYTENYCVAIRWLAIEHYFGKNDIGYDCYIRAMALYVGYDTAVNRLESFKRLIKNWDEKGYDKQEPILLSEEYEVIDGFHRVTLAKYFSEEYLWCNMFYMSMTATELHGEEELLTKKLLEEKGFSKEEMEVLDNIRLRLKE